MHLCLRLPPGQPVRLTFLAMTVPVFSCTTLHTVPPFPLPSSFNTFKSSFFKSSLYSTPSSKFLSCSVRVLW